MKYEGKYRIFDTAAIGTHPIASRANKVSLLDMVDPASVAQLSIELPGAVAESVEAVARAVVSHRREDKPVVLFTGAHLVKNGLGPLVVDLVKRGAFTLVAGTGATAIHDFELALVGETSENVPNALGKGQFGMAYEFAYINTALSLGNEKKLGYGESLGRMICDAPFRDEVLGRVGREGSPSSFSHPEVSVLAACYEADVPFTVHAGIGVDVMDQHPSFDGQAKGGCSGRDFLIFAEHVTTFTAGGCFLNVGSAVQGPEVFLKTISMAANAGKVPGVIVTADFDLREYCPGDMQDESSSGYYLRDQKSVVTRVPEAFAGTGHYVQGNQKQTVPLLYKKIVSLLSQ